jgi:hypothetical protein
MEFLQNDQEKNFIFRLLNLLNILVTTFLVVFALSESIFMFFNDATLYIIFYYLVKSFILFSLVVLVIALKRLTKIVNKIEDYAADRWMIALHVFAYLIYIMVVFTQLIKPKSIIRLEISTISFTVIDLFASVSLALIVNYIF